MSDRAAYALAHPCSSGQDVLAPELARDEPIAGGNLMRSILAVDR